MGIQIGISRFGYGGAGGGGDGELIPHNHSTPEEGGIVPLSSVSGHSKGIHDGLAINADTVDARHLPGTIAQIITDHNKALHDALAILHSSLGGIGIDNHHPKLHKAEHEVGGGDVASHDALADYLGTQHCTLPNSLANVINNHDKAIHDNLNIDADTVDNRHLPGTVAGVLTDHNKALHDALGINADMVDSLHLPGIIGDILTNHTKTVHENMGLIGGNIPSCRVRRIGDQSIPEKSWTKIIWNSLEDGWDNLNNWSTVNSEFTVPAGHAGRYLCTLVLEFEEMGDDANNKIAGGIATDRPDYEMQNITIGRWLPVHTGIYSIVLAGIVDVLVGNKIWSMCEQYNDASVNRNLSGDPRYSFLCIQKMID